METKRFSSKDFFRELYMRATPSVDLNEVKEGGKVDCTKHSISEEEYNKILEEYGIIDHEGNTLDHDRLVLCNMLVLGNGPKIIIKQNE